MAFNNNSDFYIAIHENGINHFINHAMMYVPSFLNYGSSYISANPQLACKTINADSSVTDNGNPLLSPINIQLPPILHLSPFDFIAQFPELQVDIYPNTTSLPGAFPPLANQQLALHAKTSVGLICPSKQNRTLDCFSLDLFAELALKKPSTTKFLSMYFSALDVVGIEPNELRNNLGCLLMYIANQVLDSLNNKINDIISKPIVPNVKGIVSFEVSPTTNQNNPAVEDNQVKLFTNLVSLKLNEVIDASGSSSPSSSFELPTSKTKKTRPPGNEISDLTVAISKSAISKILDTAILNGTDFKIDSGSNPIGVGSPLYIDYWIGVSLKSGDISLQDDGKIQINNLLISWDTLKFKVNVDLPKISIPDVEIPDIPTPNIPTPNIPTPNIPTPNIPTPNIPTPNIPTPNIPIPNINIPDLSLVDLLNPSKIQIDPSKIHIDPSKIQIGSGEVFISDLSGIISDLRRTLDPTPIEVPIPKIKFKKTELFGNKPDISIPIDLSGITTTVSLVLDPEIFYGIGNPNIPNCPDRWQVYVIPQLPIFFWPDIGPNLKNEIKKGIDTFFSDLISKMNNNKVVTIIERIILDLVIDSLKLIFTDPFKFAGYAANMIIKDTEATKKIDDLLSDYLEKRAPILEVQDPFPLSFKNPWGPGSTTQIPIGPAKIDIPIPISYIGLSINSNEMILEGDLG